MIIGTCTEKIILMKFSLLDAPELVILTTYSAESVENSIKMSVSGYGK